MATLIERLYLGYDGLNPIPPTSTSSVKVLPIDTTFIDINNQDMVTQNTIRDTSLNPDYINVVNPYYNMHSMMQNTFYQEFSEAITDEYQNVIDNFNELKTLYNIDYYDGNQNSFLNKISNLSSLFAISLPINFLIYTNADNIDLANIQNITKQNDLLRNIIKRVWLMRRWAGTNNGYKLPVKMLHRVGSIHLGMLYTPTITTPSIDRIFRFMNGSNYDNIISSSYYPKSINVEGLLDFTKVKDIALTWDTSTAWDISEHWDSAILNPNAGKILLVEIALDRVLYHNNSIKASPPHSLIENIFLESVSMLLPQVQKAQDIVYIGSQLSLITDSSGKFNSLSGVDGAGYSHPNIKAKFQVFLGKWKGLSTLSYVKIGTGGYTKSTYATATFTVNSACINNGNLIWNDGSIVPVAISMNTPILIAKQIALYPPLGWSITTNFAQITVTSTTSIDTITLSMNSTGVTISSITNYNDTNGIPVTVVQCNASVGSTVNTIVDLSHTWITTDIWKGYTVSIISGTGVGQSSKIISNDTSNTITVSPHFQYTLTIATLSTSTIATVVGGDTSNLYMGMAISGNSNIQGNAVVGTILGLTTFNITGATSIATHTGASTNFGLIPDITSVYQILGTVDSNVFVDRTESTSASTKVQITDLQSPIFTSPILNAYNGSAEYESLKYNGYSIINTVVHNRDISIINDTKSVIINKDTSLPLNAYLTYINLNNDFISGGTLNLDLYIDNNVSVIPTVMVTLGLGSLTITSQPLISNTYSYVFSLSSGTYASGDITITTFPSPTGSGIANTTVVSTSGTTENIIQALIASSPPDWKVSRIPGTTNIVVQSSIPEIHQKYSIFDRLDTITRNYYPEFEVKDLVAVYPTNDIGTSGVILTSPQYNSTFYSYKFTIINLVNLQDGTYITINNINIPIYANDTYLTIVERIVGTTFPNWEVTWSLVSGVYTIYMQYSNPYAKIKQNYVYSGYTQDTQYELYSDISYLPKKQLQAISFLPLYGSDVYPTLTSGLIADYRLDDNSSTKFTDYSIKNNTNSVNYANITLSKTAPYVNYYSIYNGASSLCTIPNSTTLGDLPENNMSIAFSYNFNTVTQTNKAIFSKTNWEIWVTSGSPSSVIFKCKYTNTASWSVNIPYSGWHRVLIIYDNLIPIFYIDGILTYCQCEQVYTLSTTSYTKTGTVNSSTTPTVITSPSNLTNISLGMSITGGNIPSNTYVTYIDVGANTITMSKAATGNAVGESIVFTYHYNDTVVIGDVTISVIGDTANGLASNIALNYPADYPNSVTKYTVTNPSNSDVKIAYPSSLPMPLFTLANLSYTSALSTSSSGIGTYTTDVSHPLYIGGDAASSYYSGYISDIKIWNKLLSKYEASVEILSVLNRLVPLSKPDLTPQYLYIDYINGTVSMKLQYNSNGPLVNSNGNIALYSNPNIAIDQKYKLVSSNTDIAISELGLFDQNDILVAYATFPSIIYNPSLYHLALNLLIRD